MFHVINKIAKQQMHINLLWGEGGILKSKCIYSLQAFHTYNISFNFNFFHKLYLKCQFSIDLTFTHIRKYQIQHPMQKYWCINIYNENISKES